MRRTERRLMDQRGLLLHNLSLELANEPSAALDSAGDSPDLICFSHLRWHFVTQRPQHLLSLAARDRRVFYWEEPVWHAPGELPLRSGGQLGSNLEVIEEAPNLWVVRPHITWGIDFEIGQHDLLAEFMSRLAISRYVLWYYTPMAVGFSSHLTPLAVVYDCMDELKNFLNPPPKLAERETQLLQIADVVFTGGLSLYEAKCICHCNVHAYPSSIDVPHFAQAASGELRDPADQRSISHPRAGFYGVVDERFDIELLSSLARLRPGVQFIVIGPIVKIDPMQLPKAANIHYLGGKSYAELPAYLSGWEVAILPFALNDSTTFISPTKTPEYLAAGKPVVSTPILDVVRTYGKAGLVAIADTPEAFASAIDQALLPPRAQWHDAVAVELARSSWHSTWQSMQSELDRILTSHSHSMESSQILRSDSRAFDLFERPTTQTALVTLPRRRRLESFDYLIVGAGFAGSVIAERLATQLHKRVLIIDKRDHIAGNAYDFYNSDGLLVHRYGPHIFHTNSMDVVAYLSQFTEWRPYEHRVLSSVDSLLLPIPINLDTINRLYSLSLSADGMRDFISSRIATPAAIRTSEDIVVSRVGRELYEKFFRNYTRKQWGLDPSELDASVAGRIPVRFDHDNRYFTDNFQAMPMHGYTRMFERMLSHPKITMRTGVDYREIERTFPEAAVIYTGPIDEYFGFRFGVLPYRSLEFRHETHHREFFQSAPVINFPNEHDYTRITEFKYLTGQCHRSTSIVYEFPRAEGDPYYPIPRPENAITYEKYRKVAESRSNLHFCGRLASYRYLNMDQVVAQSLLTYRRIAKNHASIEAEKISAYVTGVG
jgi:UDP-galactopyranose mutase